LSETPGFPEFKRRKERSTLQVLNRAILSLVLVTLTFAALATFLPALKSRAEQRSALAKVKVEYEDSRELYHKNTREVARLKNDPEYLGLIARDKLGLKREGETIFRFEKNTTTTSPQTVR